ncbi:hypothetical protein MRX96_042538 [Rhipicephalus microplus]
MALCQARTLVEVKADLDFNMIGFAAKVSLFAQVVAENAILRRLRLPSLKCPCAHSWLNELFLDLRDPDSADKMVPWLAAVRKNTTLRELEIGLGRLRGAGVPGILRSGRRQRRPPYGSHTAPAHRLPGGRHLQDDTRTRDR